MKHLRFAILVLLLGSSALAQFNPDSLQVPSERFLKRQPAASVKEFRPGPRRNLEGQEKVRATELLKSLAKIYAKAGQVKALIATYERILEINPKDKTALLNLGAALGHPNGTNQAKRIDLNKRLLQIDGQNAHAYYNLGNIYEEQGKLDLAVKTYKQALQFDPKHFMTINNLALIRHMRGNLDEAEKGYRFILKHMPGAPDPNFNLALILISRGKLDEAVKAVNKGLLKKPKNWQAHSILGYALSRQGKVDEAIDRLQQALTIKEDPSTRLMLAKLQLRRKEMVRASRNLQKAINNGLIEDLTALYAKKVQGATVRLSQALHTLAHENPNDLANLSAPIKAKPKVSAEDPIKVGIIVSLENNSPVPGLDVLQAATLAIEKTNRSGGIKGRPLKLTIANSGGRGDKYAKEIRRLLIEENVVALIDGAMEQKRAAADGAFFVEGIPWIVPAYTADPILSSPQLNSSWLLAERVPPRLWAETMVKKMDELNSAKAIVIFCEDSNRHRPLAHALEKEGNRLGKKLDTNLFSASKAGYLQELANKVPNRSSNVILITSPRVGAALCRQLRAELGETSQFYLGPDLANPLFFAMAQRAAEGALLCLPPYAHGNGAQGNKLNFAQGFQTMFRRFPTPTAASTYDLTVLLSMVLRRVGTDQRKLYNSLSKAGSLGGTCGPRSRAGSALAIKKLEFLQVKGRRLLPLSL